MELTPQGILGWIDRVGESYGESHDFVIIPESGIREIKAQLASIFTRLKKALEQSRKGEEIDLPEEWFELFSAILNEGIAKEAVCPECKGEREIWNYGDGVGFKAVCSTCKGTGKGKKPNSPKGK